MLSFAVRTAPARSALFLVLLACAAPYGVLSEGICEGKCSGGCPAQCPDGPAGCRSGSAHQYSLNGVGYTCCASRDKCKSVEAPSTTPPAASPSPPATSPASSVSAASATQVKFNFYNHAGTCAGAETSSPVTNTIGKNCDGPDADGHYNTVTVSGDKLKTLSYSDSSCTTLIVTLSNCECGKCCEVYDEKNVPVADVMLTCSKKEPDTSTSSASKISIYLGLFFVAAALIAAV